MKKDLRILKSTLVGSDGGGGVGNEREFIAAGSGAWEGTMRCGTGRKGGYGAVDCVDCGHV